MVPPPEEVVVEQDVDVDTDMMMPEPMQVPDQPMPPPPPPPMPVAPPPPRPQPAGQITHGYVTDGDFDVLDGEVFAGVIPYSGGGLVAEFPGVPQMAGPSMQMPQYGGFQPGDVDTFYAQPDYVPVPVPVPDYGYDQDYDMGAYDWGYQQAYPQFAPVAYPRAPRRVPAVRRRWRRW